MNNLKDIFIQNGFKVTNERRKSIEFENSLINEVIYLLPNIEITVVRSPEKIEGKPELINDNIRKNHNTSFRKFPKKRNKGKSPIHYGYAFKFQSLQELSTFLYTLNKN